jgi:hypothetical protein
MRHRHRHLAALAALPLLLTGLAACGDDDEAPEDEPRGEVTLQPADPEAPVPAGFSREECELKSGDRSLTVVLDVPLGAEPPEDAGAPSNSCWFFPQRDGVPEVHVVLLHQDEADNEADDIGSLEDVEAGFEDRVGEESVYDVVYDKGVPVFGEVEGDRLTWTSEADGIDEADFRAEAGDLQVWVTSQDADRAAMAEVFETVIASVREG